MKITRVTWIVLDSVGIGELPDAPAFGDAGAHTLGHIAETVPGFDLPELRRLGLANIAPIADWAPHSAPEAAYGKMAETSAGKDTMTGHWELVGLHIPVPFRTFPDGFPEELIREFEKRTGRPVIGNKPASGTAIIEELGEEQMRTGGMDRLHVGRQRLPDRGARGSHSAGRAVPGLRDRARADAADEPMRSAASSPGRTSGSPARSRGRRTGTITR